HGALRTFVALGGAASELQHPVRAVTDVIPKLLHGLRGDTGDVGVSAALQRLRLKERKNAKKQLPNDRDSEIPPGDHDEKCVTVVDRVSKIRERVGISSFALDGPSAAEKQRGLTDEIERDVGERDVFLENRRMPAPLREAVAEHEPVIAKSEEVFEERFGHIG